MKYKELASIFKKKTDFKEDDIFVVIDLIIFLIKMELLKSRKLIFKNFGVIYIFQSKISHRKEIKVKSSLYLKAVLKNKRKLKLKDWDVVYKILNKLLCYKIVYSMSKILNISNNEAVSLFTLFVYSMCEQLLKRNKIILNNFGTFFLKKHKVNEKEFVKDVCGRKIIFSRYVRVDFRPYECFDKELNGKLKRMTFDKCLETIFKIQKINCEVPKLPKYVKPDKRYKRPYVIKSLNHPSKKKKNKITLFKK